MRNRNANASPCYLRLYNATSNPATTDTPVARFIIPGAGGREVPLPVGLSFSTGIAFRLTTGAADNDDSAAASNEVSFTIGYA